MGRIGDNADADAFGRSISDHAHEFGARMQVVRFGGGDDQLMKVIRRHRHIHVESRVNVFAQEAGAVGRWLDCDGLEGHSIFFLCWGVGGQVRATRRRASIERTYQERATVVPGVSGSEPRKAGGANGQFAQACRARQRRAVVGWRYAVSEKPETPVTASAERGFDAVAGRGRYVPCGRGGKIVDL